MAFAQAADRNYLKRVFRSDVDIVHSACVMKLDSKSSAAFLAAPIVPAIVYSVRGYVDSQDHGIIGLIGWSIIAYGYAFSFTVIFAMPMAFLINHFSMGRWWTALLGGVAVGVLVTFSINWRLAWYLLLYPHTAFLREIRMNAILGGVAGLVFWVVWRLGDKHALE